MLGQSGKRYLTGHLGMVFARLDFPLTWWMGQWSGVLLYSVIPVELSREVDQKGGFHHSVAESLGFCNERTAAILSWLVGELFFFALEMDLCSYIASPRWAWSRCRSYLERVSVWEREKLETIRNLMAGSTHHYTYILRDILATLWQVFASYLRTW